jgi:hypothetical protein
MPRLFQREYVAPERPCTESFAEMICCSEVSRVASLPLL